MLQQQWEYCIVKGNEGPFDTTNFMIEFKGPNWKSDIVFSVGSSRHKLGIIVGILGEFCWELVSIQHGIEVRVPALQIQMGTGGSGGARSGDIREGNMFAYFKRPVITGRVVNDSKSRLEKALSD